MVRELHASKDSRWFGGSSEPPVGLVGVSRHIAGPSRHTGLRPIAPTLQLHWPSWLLVARHVDCAVWSAGACRAIFVRRQELGQSGCSVGTVSDCPGNCLSFHTGCDFSYCPLVKQIQLMKEWGLVVGLMGFVCALNQHLHLR